MPILTCGPAAKSRLLLAVVWQGDTFRCNVQDGYADVLANAMHSAMTCGQLQLVKLGGSIGSTFARECSDEILDTIACVLQDVALLFCTQVGCRSACPL